MVGKKKTENRKDFKVDFLGMWWSLKKKAHDAQLTFGPEAKLLLFWRTLHLGAHMWVLTMAEEPEEMGSRCPRLFAPADGTMPALPINSTTARSGLTQTSRFAIAKNPIPTLLAIQWLVSSAITISIST